MPYTGLALRPDLAACYRRCAAALGSISDDTDHAAACTWLTRRTEVDLATLGRPDMQLHALIRLAPHRGHILAECADYLETCAAVTARPPA